MKWLRRITVIPGFILGVLVWMFSVFYGSLNIENYYAVTSDLKITAISIMIIAIGIDVIFLKKGGNER